MITKVRRIFLILLTSSGIIAATAFTAEAGRELNHCEPPLPSDQHATTTGMS